MKYFWVIPPMLCLLLVIYALSTSGILPPQLVQMAPFTETSHKPLPQPGEFWSMFESNKGDPWYPSGDDLDHFAVMVLDVKEGWVRYCIGSIWHDERARLATFLAIYAPGMANPEDAERERIKYCQRKYAEMQKERE